MSNPSMAPASAPSSKPSTSKPAYISGGQTLDSLPLGARINNLTNNIYNFFGLYFVSLLSLDPYTAAQNSRFNTRGPGRNTGAATASGADAGRSAANGGGLWGGGRLGGAGGGGGRGSGFGSGRRMGTVDDVRGPECGAPGGSCGR